MLGQCSKSELLGGRYEQKAWQLRITLESLRPRTWDTARRDNLRAFSGTFPSSLSVLRVSVVLSLPADCHLPSPGLLRLSLHAPFIAPGPAIHGHGTAQLRAPSAKLHSLSEGALLLYAFPSSRPTLTDFTTFLLPKKAYFCLSFIHVPNVDWKLLSRPSLIVDTGCKIKNKGKQKV